MREGNFGKCFSPDITYECNANINIAKLYICKYMTLQIARNWFVYIRNDKLDGRRG